SLSLYRSRQHLGHLAELSLYLCSEFQHLYSLRFQPLQKASQ
ncbi:hypothetical protein D018_3017B, partial [Vibrio parahaemolyticus VP2007-007]